MIEDGSGFVDVEIDFERMEIAGDNNHLCVPIVEDAVVIFLIDGHSGEEGHIGQRDVNSHQFLHQVYELYLEDLDRFATPGPSEVHHEETVSQLADY